MINLDRVSVWWSWSDWSVGIWLDVSEYIVISVIKIRIYQRLRGCIYRWLEDQSRLIEWENWLVIHWDGNLLYHITLIWINLNVHDDWIETISWCVGNYCILVQMDGILTNSRWNYLLSSIWTCYCINSCYWKLLRKFCQSITYALFYCSTIYTAILSTLLLLHHWYC